MIIGVAATAAQDQHKDSKDILGKERRRIGLLWGGGLAAADRLLLLKKEKPRRSPKSRQFAHAANDEEN